MCVCVCVEENISRGGSTRRKLRVIHVDLYHVCIIQCSKLSCLCTSPAEQSTHTDEGPLEGRCLICIRTSTNSLGSVVSPPPHDE